MKVIVRNGLKSPDGEIWVSACVYQGVVNIHLTDTKDDNIHSVATKQLPSSKAEFNGVELDVVEGGISLPDDDTLEQAPGVA